ncbi:MAG TPA: LuxR family transcriptional regulator [Paraburkholderia sp.]|nr:LuxR family transcriptional regulator [Paraburkholderia sp.]
MAAAALLMPLTCAANIPSLFARFGNATRELGFSHFVISRVARLHSADSQHTAIKMVCAHYPDAWIRHYQRRGYASTDPVHRAAFTHATPYRWDDIVSLSKAERRVLDEASDAGLLAGLSIPVHEPDGSVLLFSLAGSASSPDDADISRRAYLISAQCHFELQRLTPMPSRKASHYLTPRQRACLTWVARGKTSSEIALILGISRYTVEFHIKEAKKTLNYNSRTAAAVNAVAQGLLEP